MTRLVRRDGSFFDSLSHIKVPDVYQSDYRAYRSMKKDFDQRLRQAQNSFARISRFKSLLDTMVRKIGIDNPTCKDFENFHAENEELQQARELAIQEMRRHNEFRALQEQVKNMYDQFKEMKDYSLNLDYDPRKLIGDDYSNSGEKYYGNNDVFGPNAQHGTHVAGIIAAARDNGLGMQGIADRAQIMCLRAVPRGDERDKDVANAIRYAVDNGAKIINMSFGKRYSWDKKIVDDAVKYAMNKDVLIIHAVGNDGLNLDNIDNQVFPNKYYADSSGVAEGWINVGASGWKDDSTLVAPFSNYGKTTVDVFAPGVQIYSTTPGSHYEKLDGTSMAAPVVTGLAALIREYYPKLTAVQVKDIIMKSVVKRPVLADKCVSAGVVNAYNAIGGIVIE
jgi:subtilisin family serine protease